MKAYQVFLVAITLVAIGSLSAQEPSHVVAGQSAVSAIGSVEIRKQPDFLRVQVEIVARGKDLKEALAKLKERRTALQGQLTTLGAVKETVVFEEPGLPSERTDGSISPRHFHVRPPMPGIAKPGLSKTRKPPPVFVSSMLTVHWPLKADDPDDLLVQAHNLQEKIRAADLGGLKELEQLSPQDQEIAEEMHLATDAQQGPKRGEPIFLYYTRITDADRDRALKEAYEKARREAARAARAAGHEIDALQTLSTRYGSESGYHDNYEMRRHIRPVDEEAGEATGFQATRVTFRVWVNASFALKKAGK